MNSEMLPVLTKTGSRTRDGRGIVARALVFATLEAAFVGILATPGWAAFAAYSQGDLNGQNGWDGGIVAGNPVPFTNNESNSDVVTNSDAFSGVQSWRYSGSYGSPGAGTPFTQDVATIGAPNAASVFGAPLDSPVTPAGDQSVVSFAFRAVAPGDGSTINVYEGSFSREARTGASLYLNATSATTVSLYFFELSSTDECSNQDFPTVDVATVTAGSWHTVKMTTTYPNIIVGDLSTYGSTTFIVDEGSPGESTVLGQASWVHGYNYCNGTAYTPGGSLKFSNSFNDYPIHQGFYVDDLSMDVINTATSATVGSFATGFELCTVNADCDDLNLCTDDSCDTGLGCQHVSNSAPCSDDLFCNGNDTCADGSCSVHAGDPCPGTECNTCQEETDSCVDPVATPCSDGLFCNGSDTCTDGSCSVHAGDPCPGTECNTCQEGTDSCFDAGETACSDDENVCTDDTCNGAGICAHPANGVPCSDGLFCNGADTCADASCSLHAGDPCPDGVSCTVDACDEETATCTHTPEDALCDDALYCTGVENCDAELGCQPGSYPCADTNPCTADNCMEASDSCSYDPAQENAACDDGDLCTLDDACSGGTCTGQEVVIPAACMWVMVGDAGVQSRTRGQTQVTGHICGGRVRIGEFSSTNGDVVATLASGVGIQISGHAAVSGDIVTGGSSVNGKPRLTLLPGLAVDVVAGGTTAVQSGDPTAIYDTMGTNVRVGDCAAAQGNVIAGDLLLDGLPSGSNLGNTFIAANGAMILTATNPGGLNVFDFGKLFSGTDATLTLDGAGNAGSVFVLRVQTKLDLRLRSRVILAGGTVPGNVILYSQGRCRFGEDVTGAGTVFCPNGKLIMRERTEWQGALVGGRGRVELRDSGILTHVPLQVGP